LFYHSGGESDIKGLASVTKEFYQDPTTKEEAWVSVELKAGKEFSKPVTLSTIKKNPKLKNMILLKISRLSTMPVTPDEFEEILSMSK